MELRGCSHLHFISEIRGGEVVKVPNISQQKKVLKFKTIVDVYLSNDLKCHDSLAKQPPKVNRSLAILYGSDEVKLEYKEEESELDSGEMTLKQLQDTCKSRKRKHAKSFNFAAVKIEDNNLQLQEDESELKETLGIWKHKLFKKRKAKRNDITCASINSETNSILGHRLKDVPSNLASQETREDVFKPMRIKTEDAEPEYSQQQATSCILGNDLGNLGSEAMGAPDPFSRVREIRTSLEDLRSVHLSISFPEHLAQPETMLVESQSCSLNQVSYELQETQSLGISDSSFEREDYSEHQHPLISEDSMTEGIIKINNEVVLPVPKPGKVRDMNDLVTCDDTTETVPFECNRSNTFCTPPCIDNSEVQDLGTTTANNCSSNEFDNNGEALGSLDDNKNLEAEIKTTVRDCCATVKSIKCLPLADDASPRDTIMCMVGGKRLSILGHNVASLTCSPDMQPSSATDEVMRRANESDEDKEIAHSPERLLSTRKTISPDSQERLRRALNSNDLQDDAETTDCREKVIFEKDCKDRSSSCSDLTKDQNIFTSEALNTAMITTNPRQTAQKCKDQRKSLRCRGIVKGPYVSHYSQHAFSSSSSVQGCSRNAIEFSQQQMHDIERLAVKLVTELQSMKEIVVDVLQCESRPSARFRYNNDKVRVAAENANKVEETTRKMLSMMKKDCNRFCKIMKLAEANAAASEKEAVSPDKGAATLEETVDKQRKIMFADEAGGRLCDVRIFEAVDAGMGLASPGQIQNEKTQGHSQ